MGVCVYAWVQPEIVGTNKKIGQVSLSVKIGAESMQGVGVVEMAVRLTRGAHE